MKYDAAAPLLNQTPKTAILCFSWNYVQLLLALKMFCFSFKSLKRKVLVMSVSTCLPVDCGGSDQQPDWIHWFSVFVGKTEFVFKG